ncbi:hypothetical protein PspLS_11155 [Pyricularia sp. CBS 133598]|nr:hypothetical protein PspLS_11155 [Pyricularia sp. CBS 133598]
MPTDEPGEISENSSGIHLHNSRWLCSRCVDSSEFIVVRSGSHTAGDWAITTSPSREHLLFYPWTDGPQTWMTANAGADSSYLAGQLDEFAPASLVNVGVLAFTEAPCRNRVMSLGEKGACLPPPNITLYDAVEAAIPKGAVATSCSIYVCLETYAGEAQSGILKETILSTTLASIPDPKSRGDINYTALLNPCHNPGGIGTSDIDDLTTAYKDQNKSLTVQSRDQWWLNSL